MNKPDSKSAANQRSLVLGIDTGGTYTDGVLLDYHSRQVLASHKSLTTKRDLSIGIEEVIKSIPIEDPAAIKMVSISTTLATNAIAESANGRHPKGRHVALFLIGYDPDLITSFKMEQRFATPNYYYFSGGHDVYGEEKELVDLPAIRAKVSQLKDQISAIAVSSYFSPLNPDHENRVYQAITECCNLPVVLGHQLSTKLGSVERATTAALNASLLAVLQEFVVAVRQAMKRRHINAPLMVVRGDGTLMSAEFAARIPVETIHSGPAASAIGGRFLSNLGNALVVDVGGTTTDIALIQDGQVAILEEGATVGNYKTAVKAASLLSIALGGDSHLTLSPENKVIVGPERVVPLAYLARQYPYVQDHLKTLSKRVNQQTRPDWLEYWFLLRQLPAHYRPETKQEMALVDFLRQGPQPVPKIVKQLGLFQVSQINVGHLLRREIMGKAGLTPTDLLHAEGCFTPWNLEAASLALKVFCVCLARDPAKFHRQVWSQVTETIVYAIVGFLTGKKFPPPTLPDTDMGRWFFYNSLPSRTPHPNLETRFRLRQPIIGIGAPAGIFLKDVADVLHTDLILPEHHEVANAIGAVAGSVMVTEEILVYPRLASDGLDVIGYYVQNSEERQMFEIMDEAIARARSLSRESALAAAIRSGANNPQIIMEELAEGLDTFRIRAKAVGNPRLTPLPLDIITESDRMAKHWK